MTAPGGYRPPANPAPVSGPGRLSRRTDGQPQVQLPDAAYGEQKTFRTDQAGAPMAATPGPGDTPMVSPADLSSVVGFGEPTGRPGEPVTAGAAAGPGPGVEALGLADDDDPGIRHLRDSLPALELMANQPNAGRALKQFVRRVRAMM
jgi:hypothetical protein